MGKGDANELSIFSEVLFFCSLNRDMEVSAAGGWDFLFTELVEFFCAREDDCGQKGNARPLPTYLGGV